jgi:GT2 family glycosyltransferase
MPCRDAEPWLDAAIKSLVAQTEPRFEALVLDDGSSDGTLARLGAWAERDARVRLLDPEGEGIVAALTRLARDARAPVLARMDADDVAHPARLSKQLAWLRDRPELAACGTWIRYVPRPEPGSGYARYERWLNASSDPVEIRRELLVECPIAHPTLAVRRTALEAVGGYRETGGPEDYDLVLRLDRAGYDLGNVPEVLLDWRLHGARLSERSARYSADAFRRLKIEHLRAGALPAGRPLVIWGAGKVGKAFARAWLADGIGQTAGKTGRSAGPIPVAAFVDLDPRKIGQRIHGAPVVAPGDLFGAVGGRRPFVLAAVGSPGARADIRDALQALGMVEIEDFRAVA